jgi:argininosuccinate lyase
MLGETGIISKNNRDTIIAGLNKIKDAVLEGKNILLPEDHDIHRCIERCLSEHIGELALSLRLACSRNDQIATDIRLWLRDATYEIHELLTKLRHLLVELAERDFNVAMPGYTHMQPAIPILLAHWWLAHEVRFRRDQARLDDLYRRFNSLPLGACALAGTSQPIDRNLVARYLGFDDIIENSLDAVSDRDYLVEFGSFACLTALHLSQLASELMLWSTQEFGFVRLSKAFTFKSSNMPHKRNPELIEILRSRPNAVFGRLIEILSQLKALPMGFSQDLQETLPALFDMCSNLKLSLELACIMLPEIEINQKRMIEAAYADLTNTRNAIEYLVERDIPQDKATKIVDSVVHYAKQRRRYLSDLELNEWQQFSFSFDEEIHKYVNIEESVSSLSSYGGTSSDQVQMALLRAKTSIEEDERRLLEARHRSTPINVSGND